MGTKPENGLELLEEAIADPSAAGVFYLYGTNERAKSELERRIMVEGALGADRKQDLLQMNARSMAARKFYMELEHMPTFAPRRVILVVCADKMDEECRKVYINYCDIFLEDVLLVFVNTPYTKQDEALASYHGVVSVECNLPR